MTRVLLAGLCSELGCDMISVLCAGQGDQHVTFSPSAGRAVCAAGFSVSKRSTSCSQVVLVLSCLV